MQASLCRASLCIGFLLALILSQACAGQSTAASSLKASGAATSACSDYDACMTAGQQASAAHDWNGASAAFRAATTLRPASGDPWVLLGRVLLLDGRNHQVEELAGPWDRALSLGATIMIDACHERTIRPCDRGDLVLSRNSIAFLFRGTESIFSLPPNAVESGQVLNNPAVAHVAYIFKSAGRSYAIDFFPPGFQCTGKIVVQCLGDGTARQLLIAKYVSQALPKLASAYTTISGNGAAVASSAPSANSSPPASSAPSGHSAVPAVKAAADAKSAKAPTKVVNPPPSPMVANPTSSDTILIETDSGSVRVKNFYREAKGKDEMDRVILETKPNYVISFDPKALCSQTGQRHGCFAIDLAEAAVKADETEAQLFLLQLLDVSPSAFCELPIAVTSAGDKITGARVSTPPGVCPNGRSHFQ
jgi:hypothetical protein